LSDAQPLRTSTLQAWRTVKEWDAETSGHNRVDQSSDTFLSTDVLRMKSG
jgi:hypothetical protein